MFSNTMLIACNRKISNTKIFSNMTITPKTKVKSPRSSFDFEGRKKGCIFCICISKSQRGQTKAALFSSSEFTHTVLLCGEVGIYIHLQEASPRVHFVKQQLRSPFMLSGHLGNAKLKDKNHAPPHSVCLGAPKPKLSHFF